MVARKILLGLIIGIGILQLAKARYYEKRLDNAIENDVSPDQVYEQHGRVKRAFRPWYGKMYKQRHWGTSNAGESPRSAATRHSTAARRDGNHNTVYLDPQYGQAYQSSTGAWVYPVRSASVVTCRSCPLTGTYDRNAAQAQPQLENQWAYIGSRGHNFGTNRPKSMSPRRRGPGGG